MSLMHDVCRILSWHASFHSFCAEFPDAPASTTSPQVPTYCDLRRNVGDWGVPGGAFSTFHVDCASTSPVPAVNKQPASGLCQQQLIINSVKSTLESNLESEVNICNQSLSGVTPSQLSTCISNSWRNVRELRVPSGIQSVIQLHNLSGTPSPTNFQTTPPLRAPAHEPTTSAKGIKSDWKLDIVNKVIFFVVPQCLQLVDAYSYRFRAHSCATWQERIGHRSQMRKSVVYTLT